MKVTVLFVLQLCGNHIFPPLDKNEKQGYRRNHLWNSSLLPPLKGYPLHLPKTPLSGAWLGALLLDLLLFKKFLLVYSCFKLLCFCSTAK